MRGDRAQHPHLQPARLVEGFVAALATSDDDAMRAYARRTLVPMLLGPDA